jgi:hypothetical protein
MAADAYIIPLHGGVVVGSLALFRPPLSLLQVKAQVIGSTKEGDDITSLQVSPFGDMT